MKKRSFLYLISLLSTFVQASSKTEQFPTISIFDDQGTPYTCSTKHLFVHRQYKGKSGSESILSILHNDSSKNVTVPTEALCTWGSFKQMPALQVELRNAPYEHADLILSQLENLVVSKGIAYIVFHKTGNYKKILTMQGYELDGPEQSSSTLWSNISSSTSSTTDSITYYKSLYRIAQERKLKEIRLSVSSDLITQSRTDIFDAVGNQIYSGGSTYLFPYFQSDLKGNAIGRIHIIENKGLASLPISAAIMYAEGKYFLQKALEINLINMSFDDHSLSNRQLKRLLFDHIYGLMKNNQFRFVFAAFKNAFPYHKLLYAEGWDNDIQIHQQRQGFLNQVYSLVTSSPQPLQQLPTYILMSQDMLDERQKQDEKEKKSLQSQQVNVSIPSASSSSTSSSSGGSVSSNSSSSVSQSPTQPILIPKPTSPKIQPTVTPHSPTEHHVGSPQVLLSPIRKQILNDSGEVTPDSELSSNKEAGVSDDNSV